MLITLVNESTFEEAVSVYTASWQESHRDICTPEFLRNRDYAGYLRNKMVDLYLLYDNLPVGIFSLAGENFGDLYIHPCYQRRGYGSCCIAYAMTMCKRLRLTVLSSNFTAIRLYEKSGFRFTGNDRILKDDLLEREMVYISEHL